MKRKGQFDLLVLMVLVVVIVFLVAHFIIPEATKIYTTFLFGR